MTAPQGSIAAASFAEAGAVLAQRISRASARVRPAIDYVPPYDDHGRGGGRGLDARARTRRDEAATRGELRGPLWDAARKLANGGMTSAELVEDALAAVVHRNEELVGIVAIDADRVMRDAAAADAEIAAAGGRTRSPLHGIPITVKDVIDVAGLPTRCGSDAYLDHPAADAVAVARLRAAGAVILGKVSTHEFALGVTSPQSRNPHDPSRIPGGSSGGSAVAVSTGMCLGSLGTDTRASIRVPAALSGVVGLKPTYGRVPTTGVVSLSWTMDHVAPMATTVADAAAMLDVLLVDDPFRPPSLVAAAGAAVDGLRVGVPSSAFVDAEPGVIAAVNDAVAALAAVGARVDDADRPTTDDLALANAAGLFVSRCEAAALHRSLGLDRSRYWEEVAEQLAMAEQLRAIDYVDAQRARALLFDDLVTVFDTFDLIAMPTSPVVAPSVDDFAQYLMLLARNAIPWSFLGFPAISVPCGRVGGLPVGLQLVAPWGREDLLVAAGAALGA